MTRSVAVPQKLQELVVQSEITRREAVEDLLKGHLRLADFLRLRSREKEVSTPVTVQQSRLATPKERSLRRVVIRSPRLTQSPAAVVSAPVRTVLPAVRRCWRIAAFSVLTCSLVSAMSRLPVNSREIKSCVPPEGVAAVP
jgi:hypothetical protein